MTDPWSNDFPPTFDVGTPSGAHIHFDSSGITFYRDDGVTVAYDLLTSKSEWFGTDGSSISLVPGSLPGSHPAQILFHRAARTTDGIVNSGEAAGTNQSFLAMEAPLDFNGAQFILYSDDHPNNLPVEADVIAGSTSVVTKGAKPNGGVGSHGQFTLTVANDTGNPRTVTFDGTTFSVTGPVSSTGVSLFDRVIAGSFNVAPRTNTTIGDGGGDWVIGFQDVTTAPATNLGTGANGGGYLYAQAGTLRWRGGNGTVTQLAGA